MKVRPNFSLREMEYAEYEAWFRQKYDQVSLEPGCVEIGPFLDPTPRDKPPWKLDWCVRFPDGKYLQIKERWFPRPIRLGGRGYRKHFSFHYGEANCIYDSEGVPLKGGDAYPTIIRIDDDAYGPHLHFNGEDHIIPNRVKGLAIPDAELFDFFSAVAECRASGRAFDKTMKFKVAP